VNCVNKREEENLKSVIADLFRIHFWSKETCVIQIQLALYREIEFLVPVYQNKVPFTFHLFKPGLKQKNVIKRGKFS